MGNKVAIMQPYFFPYIGYFQMIKAVDTFVFYDDVNYIKGGWINRNRILINQEAKYITVPLANSSSNKLINEIEIKKNAKELTTLYKSVYFNYKKAPHFSKVIKLLEEVMDGEELSISSLAIKSVRLVSNYLDLKTNFLISSKDFPSTRELERTERLLKICKNLDAVQYINAFNGRDLYSKEDFINRNIELNFLKPLEVNYNQYENKFVPWLSILDVLMFNSIEEVNEQLNKYELI